MCIERCRSNGLHSVFTSYGVQIALRSTIKLRKIRIAKIIFDRRMKRQALKYHDTSSMFVLFHQKKRVSRLFFFLFFFFLLLTSNTLVLLDFSISGQTRSPLPIEGSCVAKISRKSIKDIDRSRRNGNRYIFRILYRFL